MSNVSYVKPSERIEIHLVRPGPGNPWGFRLMGGKDFKKPLFIQSVNPGSVSEQCGLKGGDALLSINGKTSDAMTHDDAKSEIVNSGDQIIMLVQRAAVKVWSPHVTKLSGLQPQGASAIKDATGEEIIPVQRTSLVLNKPQDEPCRIGSTHNRSAQPFGAPKVAVPNVVHAQYNTPMGLYSADNIANSFSQQTQGIQQQMSGLDIQNRPVGSRMTGTYQDVNAKDMGQSPYGASFGGGQAGSIPGMRSVTAPK